MNTLPHIAWNYVLFVAPSTEPFSFWSFVEQQQQQRITLIHNNGGRITQKNAHTKNHSNNRMRVCSACMCDVCVCVSVCENWMGRNKIRNQRISTNTHTKKQQQPPIYVNRSELSLCVFGHSSQTVCTKTRGREVSFHSLLCFAATQPFVLYNRYVKHRDIKCTR